MSRYSSVGEVTGCELGSRRK